MGNNLFGANISGKVARSLGSKLPKATLTSVTPGTRNASNLAAGTQPTSVARACRAVSIGKSSLRKDTILPVTKDVVMILGDTIKPYAEPEENDTITIGSNITTIVAVDSDPDKATFTCQVK